MRQTSGRHHELLAEHGFEVRYPAVDRSLRSDELAELVSGCSSAILGLDEVDANVLATDGLRVIVRYGTGMDNVDIAAARRYGVLVANTPGANSVSVAELAIALMFAVARRIPVLDRSARDGSWRRMAGIELTGGRLGLVGIGAVGREVAMRAQALGMDVVAFDPMAASAPVPLVAFDDLLATSDVVSLHCPLTEDTAGLFDAEALGAMKPGSILVNTSRGGLVDEVALAAAVSAGHLAGAGIDCFAVEPLVGSPLTLLDNVVLTPHSGATTRQAVERAGVIAVEEVLRALAGRPMRHRVA